LGKVDDVLGKGDDVPIFFYAQIMLGAVLVSIAVFQFSVGSRTQNARQHHMFAVAALCAAAESFCAGWRYSASTPESFLHASKIAGTFQLLFALSLVWFVAVHFRVRQLRIPIALSVWCAAAIGLHVSLRASLLYRQIPSLTIRTFPWGESIVTPVAPVNPLLLVANVCTLSMMIYVFAGSMRLRREGQKVLGWRLAAGLAPIVFVAYPHGLLVNWGVFPPPHFYSFAFLALVFVMSVTLTEEAVRTAELTRQVDADQRRWRSLLENVNLLVAGRDVQGRLNYLNPFYLKTLGYSGDELAGSSFDIVIAKTDVARVRAWFRRFLSGTDIQNEIVSEMLTKTGHIRHIAWSSVLLYDSGNLPAGIISIGADVTESRAAEAERDQALQQLQKLKARAEAENLYLKEEVEQSLCPNPIIGQSDAILYVLQKIRQVAGTDATVLIEGETGVGKELVARALHEASQRSRGPFIRVNCAALPSSLIESELFGHEKGAFTGADRLRKGRFELAEGGTLFLDEIGELPLDMQVKLLRVLQEGEFERVGNSTTRQANVRVISATNRDLRGEVAAGRFREDLFYRLQVYPITVPSLRERREDIPLLVAEFVKRAAAKYNKRIEQIPGHMLADLKEREWPGNLRELLNVVERAVITTNGDVLTFPPALPGSAGKGGTDQSSGTLVTMASAERSYILRVLAHTAGKIAGKGGAAEILDMHPNTLRARMDKLGILKHDDRDRPKTISHGAGG
jgi:formate hydrogenlyase transcriptional activator